MLRQGSELMDRLKHIDELGDSTTKKVEATKNERLAEIELLALGQSQEGLLRGPVLLLIGIVQLDAGVEIFNQMQRVFLPQLVRLFTLKDTLLAVCDHLIGDLGKEVGHSLGGIIVPCDGVDHLHGVHQCGKGVHDGGRATDVERLDELLERGEVLDVVLGFVEGLSDGNVDLLPPPQCIEDGLARLRGHVLGHPRDGPEKSEDHLALLGPELLCDGSDLLKPIAPEVQLRPRAWVP
mmetsp:Transcript_60780/g.98402  ORF Transcript_60780/g.98402 Transcript_60780/m.98402 type:complete len:237 (-) Transcript_60780:109-819(-)